MTLVIEEDRLTETFAALANSTRRAILAVGGGLEEAAANMANMARVRRNRLIAERPGKRCWGPSRRNSG